MRISFVVSIALLLAGITIQAATLTGATVFGIHASGNYERRSSSAAPLATMPEIRSAPKKLKALLPPAAGNLTQTVGGVVGLFRRTEKP